MEGDSAQNPARQVNESLKCNLQGATSYVAPGTHILRNGLPPH